MLKQVYPEEQSDLLGQEHYTNSHNLLQEHYVIKQPAALRATFVQQNTHVESTLESGYPSLVDVYKTCFYR